MRKRSKGCKISAVICPCCEQKIPIPRMIGEMREKHHKKNVFCPFCGPVVGTEIKYNDYYVKRDGSIIYGY